MTASAISPALDNIKTSPKLPPEEVVFGCSGSMRQIRKRLEMAAKVNVPVLILGESGTGKELIANYVHSCSPWSRGPFVKVTCPAIPGTLLESELFGYEKGSFTGAYGQKKGRVEAASRGTLFLDEISELEIGLQAKLLQLLQDGTFCRIGGQKDQRIEVRIVCACNRNLETEIEAGTFRLDLYHRLNGISISLPALRDRLEDIPVIANYLLDVYKLRYNTSAPPFSAAFLRRLQQYGWPGNIRELENVVRRYAILGSESELLPNESKQPESILGLDLPLDGSVPLKELTQQAIRQIEETVIRAVLARNHNNRKKTAEILGLSYRMLLYKLREMKIPSLRSRRQSASQDNATTIPYIPDFSE